MKRRLLLPVVIGVSALAVAAQTQAMSAPKLKGTVGPGFTISLKDGTGKKVTTLKAGKYTFVVTDKSSIHNFELERTSAGPKFEKEITDVSQVITNKTVTYTLTKGKYKYYCKPHEGQMHGTFTVT
jgi:plastocyanin